MDDTDSLDLSCEKSLESVELEEDEPQFKDIWKTVEEEDDIEEYAVSDEIMKDFLNGQEVLYNTLFSVKYFRSDAVNADSEFIKLSKQFDNVKEKIILEHEESGVKLATLAKNHLKKKEEDEELQIDDQGAGTFLMKCPISQMPFEKPVTQRLNKNKDTCDHTFEKTSLQQLMGKRINIDCPLAACGKKVFRNKLHPDYEYIQHRRYKELVDSVQRAKDFFENLRKAGDDFDFFDENKDNPHQEE